MSAKQVIERQNQKQPLKYRENWNDLKEHLPYGTSSQWTPMFYNVCGADLDSCKRPLYRGCEILCDDE
jgi:hypothetical protein